MSLLDRLEGKSGGSITNSLELFREVYGGWKSNSGMTVNYRTALQVTTFLACARLLGNGLAQVPLKLFKESADGRKREPVKEHPLYYLLHRKPNFFQTAFEYRQMIGLHLMTFQAHYSFINRVRGDVYELLPFEPQHVHVKRDPQTYKITYEIRPESGAPITLPREAVWHIKGLSWNGYLPLETVKLGQEALGLALSAEAQHANMHKNGAQVSGMISVEGNLTNDKYTQMRAWLEKYFEGVANKHAGRTMILDRGAKFTQAQQSGVESQHLETRRLQIEETCRVCGMQPIMVGHSDKTTTYASAESMFLAHVVHSLSPWYECLEQSIDANLLTDKDRKAGIYAKHVIAGLLRGAMKDTKDYLLGLVNGGVMYPNEAREALDLNADDDPKSDELRIPANVVGDPAATDDGTGGDPKPSDENAPKGKPAAPIQLSVTVEAQPLNITIGGTEVKNVMPEQNAPTIDVHVPPQPVPDVKVTVEAPAVTVNNDVKAGPTEIKVVLPVRKSESVIERDKDGNIIRVKQTEKSA